MAEVFLDYEPRFGGAPFLYPSPRIITNSLSPSSFYNVIY